MLQFIIVLLTTFLLIDCLLLILLVLVQLPKKEAGMGLAFGAGTADALLGAGSGNAMTQITKYAAAFFLGLVIILSILAQSTFKRNTSGLEQQLKAEANKSAAPKPAVVSSNATPFKALTNPPAAPTTTPAPAAPAPVTPAPANPSAPTPSAPK